MKFSHTLSISLALIFLFAIPVYASGTWIQKESGAINAYHDVTRSNDNIVAVGNGTVYSSDASTWLQATSITSSWLNSIAKDSSGTLYAVGDSSTLISSINNGISWSPIGLNISNSNLYAIAFGGTSGFIAGSDGRFLYHSDQTNLWIQSNSPVTTQINALSALSDSKTAFAVGNNGVFLKTTAGGVNWTNLGSIIGEHLRGVYFKDEQTGWVVGTNGTFLKTTSGGTTWSSVSVEGLSAQELFAIEANGETMVIAGKNIVLRSEDGGATWTSETFGDVTLAFRGVSIDDNGEVWVAGTKDDVWSKIYKFEISEEPVVVPEEEIPPVITEPTDFGEASSGDLIKTVCTASADVYDPCKAVYFLSEDGKRHAFPNERVYFTWYSNFNGIVEVSSEFMGSRTLGKNVTYHPGKKMVKFQSMPSVYVVKKGSVLRAIASEEVARQMYGETWNQQIDDIADVFYGNYTFGEKVESSYDYDRLIAEASVSSLNDNF